MTRINVGINPKELTNKHLIAEHREIKRIPNMVRTGRAKMVNIPDNFRLGKGHVKFFYNKLGYLLKRYKLIYQECINRGFNVQNYSSAWVGIPKEYMNDYRPTKNDIRILKIRIASKLKK